MLRALLLALLVGTTTPTAAPVAIKDEPIEPPQTVENQIVEYARKEGVDPQLPMKIAYCESTHRQFDEDGSVLRGKANPQDVGVFQINEYYHLADSKKLGYDIHTQEGNIAYAMQLYKKQGSRPWNWSKPCWGK